MKDWINQVSRNSPVASRAAAFTFALALLAPGCSSDRGKTGPPLTVQPPVFLNGPMGLLLTNTAGFHAHVVLETRRSEGTVETESGELFGRGAQLLFAPDADGARGKYTRAGGVSFLWDVAAHHGYVMSEAMQGYAPMSSDLSFTNVTAKPAGLIPERINGHRCDPEDVTMNASDGSTAAFQVWRAADLHGFPLRISAATKFTEVILQCSRYQPRAQADELFRPPEGFTGYESAEGMMAEMAARKANLKRKEPATEELGGPQGPSSRPPGSY